MRQTALQCLLALSLAFVVVGCKKPKPAAGPVVPAVEEEAGADLGKLAADLKSNAGDRRAAAVRAAVQYDTDGEEVVPVLLEALKDSTAAPLGQTFNDKAMSTREAAVLALVKIGPKGKKALTETGLKTLEQGLKDPKPNVREHTANALGMAGPDARPVAAAVAVLCAEKDREVRAAAYRALQKIKSVPTGPILKLLINADIAVASDAAESLAWLKPTGAEAVAPLIEALNREPGEKEGEEEVAYIRKCAAEALASVGSHAEVAIPALVDRLSKATVQEIEKMVRGAAGNGRASPASGPVLALRRIGRPAVAAVSPLLKHKEPIVRYQAASVLSGMGQNAEASLPAVLEALGAERNLPTGQMYVFEELIVAAVNLGGDPSTALAPLIEMMKGDTDDVRGRAAELIARFGRRAAPAVPQLIALLGNKDRQIQTAAIRALAAIGPAASAAAPELANRLADPNVARDAAVALRAFGPAAAPAVPALAKALASNDQNLCIDAARALAAIGPEAAAATDSLAKRLGDKTARLEERLAYLQTLSDIGPNAKAAVPAVVTLLGDKDYVTRVSAAACLGRIGVGDAEVAQKLAGLLKDSFPVVRVAGLKALAAQGPAAHIAVPAIKTGMEKSTGELKVWSAAALVALGTEPDANSAIVLAALRDKSPAGKTARAAAMDAVPVLGAKAKSAVPDLMEALKDKTPAGARADAIPLRERAAQTIGILGADAKEAVPALIDMLRDGERNARRGAAEALGRIGPAAVLAVPKLRELAESDSALAETALTAIDRIEPAPKME